MFGDSPINVYTNYTEQVTRLVPMIVKVFDFTYKTEIKAESYRIILDREQELMSLVDSNLQLIFLVKLVTVIDCLPLPVPFIERENPLTDSLIEIIQEKLFVPVEAKLQKIIKEYHELSGQLPEGTPQQEIDAHVARQFFLKTNNLQLTKICLWGSPIVNAWQTELHYKEYFEKLNKYTVEMTIGTDS